MVSFKDFIRKLSTPNWNEKQDKTKADLRFKLK